MSNIAERLSRAVRNHSRSLSAFQQAMNDRNVPGTSIPAIYRYLRGEITPSVEFLTAAADVLGVRAAWLILGEGGMIEDQSADSYHAFGVAREMVELVFPPFGALPFMLQNAVLQVWAGHLARAVADRRFGSRFSERSPADREDMGRRIGEALSGPFANLGIPTNDVDEFQMNTYILAMTQALAAIIRSDSVATQLFSRRWQQSMEDLFAEPVTPSVADPASTANEGTSNREGVF